MLTDRPQNILTFSNAVNVLKFSECDISRQEFDIINIDMGLDIQRRIWTGVFGHALMRMHVHTCSDMKVVVTDVFFVYVLVSSHSQSNGQHLWIFWHVLTRGLSNFGPL